MLGIRSRWRVLTLLAACLVFYQIAFQYEWVKGYLPSLDRETNSRRLHISNFKVPLERIKQPVILREHNLMKLPHFKFHPDFKNPCWYEKSETGNGSQLRCLPYFYVIGIKKSGTCDLVYRTMQHPDIISPGAKELQWYPKNRFYDATKANINYFIDMVSKRTTIKIEEKTSVYKNNTNYHPIITGDGTPANLHVNTYWKLLPGNEGLSEPRYVNLDYIHHVTPGVKIIIIFRNPIDRSYSDYFHEYSRLQWKNKPSQAQFHSIVTEGIQLYKECFKVAPLRACVYEGSISRKTRIQMQLGLYSVFWRELLRVFPRENILYLHTLDYAIDKRGTLEKVFSFLDMGELTENKLRVIENAEEVYPRSPKNKAIGPMWDSTRKMLFDFYKPFADEMVQLTGDDKFRLT